MSIAQRDKAWKVQGVSSTQKLVLLALAEHANDSGECYPSVALLAERTCLSDRAVQKAIGELERMGVIARSKRNGTSTIYQLDIPTEVYPQPPNDVHPRTTFTPNDVHPTPEPGSPQPPNDVHPTPERRSPKPSINRQMNRKGTENKGAGAPDAEPKPLGLDDLAGLGVGDEVAREFLAHRKRQKKPLTPLALRGLQREAERAGWTLEDAMRCSVERGWLAFKAEWVAPRGRPGVPALDREAENERRKADFLRIIDGGTPFDDPNTIDMEPIHATR